MRAETVEQRNEFGAVGTVDEPGTREYLRDEMDATPVLEVANPRRLTSAEQAKRRGLVRRQIVGCEACQLRADQPDSQAPVPFTAPRSPLFVAVGEAPGPQESRRGEPFVGPSGKALRRWMEGAGFDVDGEVAWCNTVSCFPNENGKVRAPAESEIAFCRENLLDQLAAINTSFVLLVGAKAFNSFRSDLTITEAHGRVFVWLDRWIVMGIMHPAGALRGVGNARKTIKEDLARWRDVLNYPTPYDASVEISAFCVKCNELAVEVDRDGVAWCARHVERGRDLWKKERARWGLKVEQLKL